MQKESASAKKPLGPTITINYDGRPVLPDIDFSKGKLLDMKTLLREYLTKCYQNSTGDAKARIPWEQLQQNPGKFIEMMAGFLPEGASLLDPSHIRQGVLIDILCHSKERQDNKDIMVIFKFKSTYRPMLERRSSMVPSSSPNQLYRHSHVIHYQFLLYITNSKPIPSPNVADSKSITSPNITPFKPLTSPNTAECNPSADSEFIPNKKKKGKKR